MAFYLINSWQTCMPAHMTNCSKAFHEQARSRKLLEAGLILEKKKTEQKQI